MPDSALRIAIVGGGIGGLAAACALERAGLPAVVYEQAEAFAEIGAGIALAPNAVRLLTRLRLDDALDEVSCQPGGYEMRSWSDGHVIADSRRSERLAGMRSLTVHRAHLLEVLLGAVDPASLHPAKRCVQARHDGSEMLLSFEDGTFAATDVVVGADGIHSVIRSMFHSVEPMFVGQIAYRGLIPMERLSFLNGERRNITFWLGPRRHFLTYPVAGGRLMNVVAFVPHEGEWTEKPGPAPAEVAEVAEQFTGWDPTVIRIVEALDGTARWALYDLAPLSAWTFDKMTLLGDAAHAMLPHVGQGAGQSIEDAVVLARCLATARRDDLGQWLRLYEGIRRPRTERVQRASRLAGEIYDLADSAEQERRAPGALEARGEWLWSYDAERAFEEARRALIPGPR
jgi:salicylate hydroxylase